MGFVLRVRVVSLLSGGPLVEISSYDGVGVLLCFCFWGEMRNVCCAEASRCGEGLRAFRCVAIDGCEVEGATTMQAE